MSAPALVPPSQAVYGLCRGILAGAARLVPHSRRLEWRREWDAEVWSHVQSLAERGALTPAHQIDLCLRCLGAFRHATWLRGRAAARIVERAWGEMAIEAAWTSTMILTMGLSFGAAAAVFSAAWMGLTRPDPDSRNDRVVRIWNQALAGGIQRGAVSPREFVRFGAGNRSFERIAAFRRGRVALGDGVELPMAAFVSPDFFSLFGVGIAGTDWSARTSGTPIVLGYDLWLRRFAGDRSVIGRPVVVDGRACLIAGVAPPGFRYPRGETDVWMPLAVDSSMGPGERTLVMIGLLRPGVSRRTAAADLSAVSRELQQETPGVYFGRFGATWSVVVEPLSRPGQGYESILLVLAAASVLATIIVLLAAASAAGVRKATGVLSVDAVAALLASGLAIVAGLVTAMVVLRRAGGALERWMPGLGVTGIGRAGWAFVAVSGLLAAAGIFAGRRISDGLRRIAGDLTHGVTMAMLVMLGWFVAGFAASYQHLREDGPGFRENGLLAIRPPLQGFEIHRLRELPGITVARATGVPYLGTPGALTFEVEGADSARLPVTSAAVQYVDAAYFGIMAMRPRAGRWLRDGSDEVVVSQAMARRFWPGGQALGRRLMVYVVSRHPGPWVTVVGIAPDVRRGPPNGDAGPMMYLPTALAGSAPGSIVARGVGRTAHAATLLAREVGDDRVVRIADRVSRSTVPHRSTAIALTLLALTAIAGGVLSYRDRGGARGRLLAAGVTGSLVGVGGAVLCSSPLSDVLYRVHPGHILPGVFLAVTAIGLAQAAVAPSPPPIPRTASPA